MIVPPLPCPIAPQLILLQTARPGEFEQFGADDGGELRRQRPVLTLAGERPGAGRGSWPGHANRLASPQTIQDRSDRARGGVALRLNVRLRPIAKITAVEDEIHGARSFKLAA